MLSTMKKSPQSFILLFCVSALSLAGAPKKETKASPEQLLEEAQAEYRNYNFAEASEKLRKYKSALKKGVSPADICERLSARIEKAGGFMNGVEKITVIDSISVPREDFYRSAGINSSAGRFADPSEIDFNFGDASVKAPVYISEDESVMIWAADTETMAEDSTMTSRCVLMESTLLSDGTRGKAEILDIKTDGNLLSPFMMPDGQTLYFASDGSGSIGGYDIFVTKRDAVTGEFFTPSNIGFPYNSPADDFLIAFDEEAGAALWATDRNSTERDSVTIYRYLPAETRVNCDEEEDDIASRAKMDNYKSTWGENDYEELAARLREITPEEDTVSHDFTFRIDRNTVYHSYDDFSSEAAADAMEEYLDALEKLAVTSESLAEMRRQWAASPSDRLRNNILEAEESLLSQRKKADELKNRIIKLESPKRS